MATSLPAALKKEPRSQVDDAWVDDEWKKENPNQLESAIGFEMDEEEQVSGCEAQKRQPPWLKNPTDHKFCRNICRCKKFL